MILVAALQKAGAESARGDLKEPDTLRDACAGVRSVISPVSMIVTGRESDSFEATDAAGTKHLIDAARKGGAEQFIFVLFDTARSRAARREPRDGWPGVIDSRGACVAYTVTVQIARPPDHPIRGGPHADCTHRLRHSDTPGVPGYYRSELR